MWNFCILLTITVLGTSNGFRFNYNHDNIVVTNTCKSLKDEWKCCQTSPKIRNFKLTACGDLKLLRKNMGMTLSMTFNGYSITTMFSVRNPPSICIPIPYPLKACIKFYNMDWGNQTLSGCLAVQAILTYFQILDLKIGCFKFPLTVDNISKTEKLFLKEFHDKYNNLAQVFH